MTLARLFGLASVNNSDVKGRDSVVGKLTLSLHSAKVETTKDLAACSPSLL
jgi:hypothetical protein